MEELVSVTVYRAFVSEYHTAIPDQTKRSYIELCWQAVKGIIAKLGGYCGTHAQWLIISRTHSECEKENVF